ncbi:MAG: hypothetical protein LUQ65_02320 [Candidatus Helarchaeota archaeon]|nr:hypothetical protein [Candidatus Helarchaeota archaeon]
MVLKNIERLKAAIPEIFHIVMFYDDGTIFQTTFQQVNVPQIGENLAEGIKHIAKLFEITKLDNEPYTRLIYETKTYIILVIKVGEQSNLALFFRKGPEEPQISAIKNFISRIQAVMDTDRIELDKQTLEKEKTELNALEQEMKAKLDSIELKKSELPKLDEKLQKDEEALLSKEKELPHEAEMRKQLESYIQIKKESLQEIKEKGEKKLLEREIKGQEKNLEILEKVLSSTAKETGKSIARLRKESEIEKERIIREINFLAEDIKKLKSKTSEKYSLISQLMERISYAEKEKLKIKMELEKSLK